MGKRELKTPAKKTTAKAAAPSSAQPARAVAPGAVVIRSAAAGDEICRVPFSPALQRAAMEWTFVLRNRRRWAQAESSISSQSERVARTLQNLGVTREHLVAIAEAGVVEVAMGYRSESDGWEGRVFPWEHALSAATRPFRSGRSLTIVRNIARSPKDAKAVGAPGRVLYVESAPCGLRDNYSFDGERELVTSAFERPVEGRTPILVKSLIDPSLASLKREVEQFTPDVIHFAGFDTHQACRVLPEHLLPDTTWTEDGVMSARRQDPERVLDGCLLAGEGGKADLVPALKIAEVLNAGANKPSLVSFNIYNSGARLAALTVACGAGASLGYQDDFNDRLAELLYERLYRAWAIDREDLLSAFQYAWSEVRDHSSRLTGTGIVLWGQRSWIEVPRRMESLQGVEARADDELKRLLPTPGEHDEVVIKPEIVPLKELNYSVLHNRKQQIFKRFVITKPPGRVDNVQISASLALESASSGFEATATRDDPDWRQGKDSGPDWRQATVDLSELVCVPLVSRLLRSLHEGVKTTITAKVQWGDRIIYHQTHPVTLLAIDEWKDDDENRMWLPSFVQPGDRGVLRVIEAAQKYLAALSDDFVAAGFDGYQREDPEYVDTQARAIWTALVQDFNLSYINPPPTAGVSLQRLRTPSAVLDGRRGTCIDLAILYAACLELVNIHPVLVLLTGHAFPAYWRSEAAHDAFARPEPVTAETEVTEVATGGSSGDPYPWYRPGRRAFSKLMNAIRAGDIVPLETVFLTQRASFEESVKEGHANLSRPEEFDSILDVRTARDENVTSLPLSEERAS